MATHYLLHCKECGLPMLLPSDTLERPFSNQDPQPNDSLAVGVVSRFCKSVETYFLHAKNPNWNPKDQAVVREDRIEDTVHVNTLRCESETCEFLLPIFAQWKPSTTVEERQADILIWKWENLNCPEGHSILKPNIAF